jgi:EAL domain-containing protein (putative c-di-GMP-specific phosphodiesterase class I)
MAIHSLEAKKVRLEKNLDLSMEIQSREHLRSYKAHHEILEADSRLEKLLRTLEEENLSLYYQPKIDLKAERCGAFEALLRYEKDGRMQGPDFLETLEQAGLAPVIDRWVARQAKMDLQHWRSEEFHPEISINLHPDTVRSRQVLLEIVRILQGERITFEIIERSFLHRSDTDANLSLLREHGFRIAIDDFGTGYSSLETITRYRIDELKLDKSLIDIIDTRKGYLVCKHTASLCHELGCLVVAEGVEKREQLERIRTIAVDGVQGYLYASALPPAEAKSFAENYGRGSPADQG